MSSMWYIAQQGSYVYAVPYSGTSLWTIDVSDPAHPFVASTLTMSRTPACPAGSIQAAITYARLPNRRYPSMTPIPATSHP